MDAGKKKQALRLITYGLYVVTARDDDRLAAGTITWFSQSSFHPPLVMAGIQRRSSLNRAIHASRAFAVHFLGRSQKELATRFFKPAQAKGDLLSGCRFEPGVTGAPVLADPPAWIECRVVDEVDRGDHTVFVAEVVAAGVRREEEPLTLRDAGFSYGG
jgi:flavin reductase (DIM6/NTAB) family NADH-FMN oxidoreductase RutF